MGFAARGLPAVAAAASLTLLCGGCGGRGRLRPPLQQGRAVFAAACASCHTLTGRDTETPGGDLAIADLGTKDIASFVRVMPVRLSPADVEAVAAYVHAAVVRDRHLRARGFTTGSSRSPTLRR